MSISQNFPAISPTLNLNFARSKKLDPRITFTRSSSATRTNAQGLIETVSTDIPRFDHSYNSSTGSVNSLGLLIEESRTNLITDSATDYGYGISTGQTPTNDVAPNGNTVACKYDLTGALQPFLNVNVDTSLSPGSYTMSMWLKGTTSFSASFAFVGETNVEIYNNTADITTSWQRFTLTFTLLNSQINSRLQVFFGSQGEGKVVSVWGAQLEAGAFATSYIPRSSGAQATRSGDLAFINLPSTGWYNYSQGSLVFQHSTVPFATGTSPGYPAVGFAQTDGGSTNSIQYFFTKDGGTGYYLVRDANVDQVGLSLSGSPAAKVGFAYTTNLFVLARNGSQVGTDASGTVPQSIGTLLLGGNAKNVANNFNACISNVIYYPRALSSSQLQNLTK
jgi:hypothetical protein